MPKLVIHVGASADRSIASVFKSVVAAAREARLQVNRELNGIGASGPGAARGGPYRAMVRDAEKADSAIVASARKRQRAIGEAFAATERDAKRGFEAEQKRTTSFARRTSYRTIHHVNAMIRGGMGLASDMARGAGVDLSMGSMIGRAVSHEKSAVDLSNQGYMPGQAGPNGEIVRGSTILAGARATANEYARTTDDVLEATSKMVSLTGDLSGARAIMGDLAKLTNATGGSLVDMASAAGNVSNAIGQGFVGTDAEKLAATNDVMRAIAGQGKVGAVEIKDLATQMAKLGAVSGMFSGKREDTLGFVGIMAQLSRKGGGSASATQAASSVLAFGQSMSKPSSHQLKAMESVGIDPRDKSGLLKGPEELLKELVFKTKGDQRKLGGIVSTSGSMRAVRELSNTYAQAGGGAKGEAAVTAELEELKQATLDAAAVQRANAAAVATVSAKAIKFQNNLDTVAASMADRVLPQLEALAPKILQATSALGDMVGFAATNPWTAVSAALAASIARAGIESTVRKGIDAALTAAGAAKFTGIGGSSAAAGLGTIGAVLVIAGMVYKGGTWFIDAKFEKESENKNVEIASEAENKNALTLAESEARNMGSVSRKTADELHDAFISETASFEKHKRSDDPASEVQKMNREFQEATLNRMAELLAKISMGIPVTNLPAGSLPPYAYQGGRTGAPGTLPPYARM